MAKKKETNYAAFFPMGICFVGVGVVFTASVNKVLGIAFMVLGGAYMIIGAKHGKKKK
ncbi:hypothetical protein HN935_02045 [archaeon]|jgi:hypothetical protein|nr:hypothetical protein [archaeon]